LCSALPGLNLEENFDLGQPYPTTSLANFDLAFRLNRGSVSRKVLRKNFPL
jgi:hypothetical protein